MRALAILALLFTGCKTKDDTDTVDTDPDTDTDIVAAEFGYDTRPANPDCVAPPDRFSEAAEIEITRVFNTVSLSNPVGLYQAPGDADSWYVIEQSGRVKRFDGSVADPTAEVVLDITGPVSSGGEAGLLGLAFHPDFANNGMVYLSYTTPGLVSHVSSIQTSNNGTVWDEGSLTSLISVDQPYDNHNGGHIVFGPDGMLYWGLGDGGAAGDPENRALNLGVMWGKIHRIDVNTAPYAIPPDNPFVGVAGAREEIYAYGLRNPWRFSFDSSTGELWAGDVGQNAVEEIDLIEAGGNYGWRLKEGRECYATDPCEGGGLIDPIVQYRHNAQNPPPLSVMGGVVYRGSAIPSMVGTYLFGEYYLGRIHAIAYDPATGEPQRVLLFERPARRFVHFAEGNDREVYVLDRDNGGIFRIDPVSGAPAPDFPQTLSETGCVNPADPTRVVEGVIPFEVNHPLWSDGAQKRRWLAIPDSTSVDVDADGDFLFPVGTVLMKEFVVNGQRVETRLFMRHADEWAGYAYKWRADGSDADLIPSSEVVDAAGQDWEIPSRAACMQCHTQVAGRSLGPELGQLSRIAVYPATGREAPQLATLAHIGILAADPGEVAPWPAMDDGTASVEDRVRTYLQVNCSQCHRPDGPGRGQMDFRSSIPFSEMGLCGEPEHGDLGVADTRIVTPGDPSKSILSLRMKDLGAYRMPPIGTAVVDEEGLAVIDEWITGLGSCP